MNIYVWLLIILFILTFLFTKKKYRSFINPAIFFCGIWIVITGLASFRWLDMYPSSDEVQFLILIGVCFFIIGAWGSYLSRNITIKCSGKLPKATLIIRYRLLEILACCCIAYYIPSMIISLMSMINGLSLNDVRSIIQDGEYSTGFRNFIPNFVILPISVALEPLAAVDSWFGKRNKCFIILILALVLVRTLGDGGRTPFFNVIMYFAVGFFLSTTNKKKNNFTKKENKKDKKKIKRILILGVGMLFIFSLMRASGTLIRKLYFYFSMSPVLLKYWKEYVDSAKWRTYGVTSFNGIFYFFDYFRKNLTGTEYTRIIKQSYDLIHATDSNWIKIAPQTTANAYVSCFWFFYIDGGILGVVILSMIYGFLTGRIYYRLMIQGNNIRSITTYLLLFQGIFFSFIRFPFAKVYYCIAMVVIAILAFKPSAVSS